MPGIPDRQTAFEVTGSAIILTLIGGSVIFFVSVASYSLLHRFDVWPKIYSARWYHYPNRTPMMERHRRYLFSWITEILYVPEDEILRTVGLDALVFLRTQRLYAILFILCSILGVGILVPLNIRYGDAATNDYYQFARTTMANLPSRSRIKNPHVYRTNIAACWIFSALCIGLLWLEYRSYIALRFKWLTLPRTHNYSIMVTHIPPKMRNVSILKTFFDKLLAPHGPQLGESVGKVLSVTLTMDLARMEQLVAERDTAYRQLEHRIALYHNPEHREWCRLQRDRQLFRKRLLKEIKQNSEKLQLLNEVVECAQQEVRRLYYGFNDPSNFGLLDVEVTQSGVQPSKEALPVQSGPAAEDVPLGVITISPPTSPTSGPCEPSPFKSTDRPTGNRNGDQMVSPVQVLGEAQRPDNKTEERQERSDDDEDVDGIDLRDSPLRPYRSCYKKYQRSTRKQDPPQLPDTSTCLHAPPLSQPDEEAPGGLGRVDTSCTINTVAPEDPRTIIYHSGSQKGPTGGLGFASGQHPTAVGGEEARRLDYGSFSPSTLPCDDRRPSLSLRSRATLEDFFRKPISSEVYGTAFVTLSTLEATAILRQTVTYQRAFELIVEEAPLPEDIIWSNVDSNFVTNYLRTAIGHLLTFAITIAFAFPTAFISALNSVQTMKRRFPWIGRWLPPANESRWLNSLLAIVAPLLLLILLSIIPPIFGLLTRTIIKDSRTISESHYNIYRRYFGFLFYNALIVFVVTTSFVETLFRAYSNPAEVLNQIGSTLPKPSAFFINFIIIKALSGLPCELIRINSFLTHFLKIAFLDDLTEQNRSQVIIGCRSITHPGGFHYGKFLAEHTLLFVYILAYSCLAPVILPAGFVFFASSYLVYKRQLLFVYEPEYETGGKMFKLILRYTFTGLFVGQFVIFVMLVTKFDYEDIPFFLPLPILTYFAKDLIIKWYGRMDNHVPLSLAVAKDVRFWRGPGKVPSTRSGEILDLSKDTFHHPAVRAPWCELSWPLPKTPTSLDSLHELSTSGVKSKGTLAYEKVEEKDERRAAKRGERLRT